MAIIRDMNTLGGAGLDWITISEDKGDLIPYRYPSVDMFKSARIK